MFLGRADEMVKAARTNVFPLACQNAITKDLRTTGDFICVGPLRWGRAGAARRDDRPDRAAFPRYRPSQLGPGFA